MTLMQLYDAVVRNKKNPPQGEITSAVSQALQDHECAVARLNRVACDVLHGANCHCCENPVGMVHQ